MPTKLKSETARANGAKSKGPKTAETREKSSRNSLKHGLTTRHNMLLACEDPALFQQVVDEYTSVYQPTNPVERDLVEEMIGAKWRIRRLKLIEVALVDYEMANKKEEIEDTLTTFDHGIHLGVSFKDLSDGSRSISLLSRYESRLHRISHRAHQTFLDLRRALASGLLAPPAAQPKPELPADTDAFQNPPTGNPVAPPAPQAEPTPDPKPAAASEQAKPAAAPARPVGCGGQKKFKNEPTIRRVLRRIRNHRALNAAFRRSKKGPAPAAQACDGFRDAS